jgi:flagellar biosynthesis protein FlhB
VSDDQDKHGKTEAPTEKKLSDAIEKGNTPFSREIVSLASLLAMIAALTLMLPEMVFSVTSALAQQFALMDQPVLNSPGDTSRLFQGLIVAVLFKVAPLLVLLAVGGVAGSLLQNIPSAASERVAPDWSRLSPGKNLSKIIGKEALVEFAKAAVKFAVLAALIYFVLKAKISAVFNIGLAEPSAIPGVLLVTVLDILAPITILILVLAVVDLVWTRLKWWNDLKMTRQEQKEEHKNAEGDPLLKQRRRMIAQKRLKGRMMADVPKATLVVVNPTHFAVAMRYVAAEGGAPVVLAKGLDLVALKIRELSEEHKVPIVENKPLARSLYAATEVGDMIPPEYYKAVAEVIHFVERRRQLASNAKGSRSSL